MVLRHNYNWGKNFKTVYQSHATEIDGNWQDFNRSYHIRNDYLDDLTKSSCQRQEDTESTSLLD